MRLYLFEEGLYQETNNPLHSGYTCSWIAHIHSVIQLRGEYSHLPQQSKNTCYIYAVAAQCHSQGKVNHTMMLDSSYVYTNMQRSLLFETRDWQSTQHLQQSCNLPRYSTRTLKITSNDWQFCILCLKLVQVHTVAIHEVMTLVTQGDGSLFKGYGKGGK